MSNVLFLAGTAFVVADVVVVVVADNCLNVSVLLFQSFRLKLFEFRGTGQTRGRHHDDVIYVLWEASVVWFVEEEPTYPNNLPE